jgi:hypothetical protein
LTRGADALASQGRRGKVQGKQGSSVDTHDVDGGGPAAPPGRLVQRTSAVSRRGRGLRVPRGEALGRPARMREKRWIGLTTGQPSGFRPSGS